MRSNPYVSGSQRHSENQQDAPEPHWAPVKRLRWPITIPRISTVIYGVGQTNHANTNNRTAITSPLAILLGVITHLSSPSGSLPDTAASVLFPEQSSPFCAQIPDNKFRVTIRL